MFPLGDDNPTLRTPVVTIGIIATMLVVWVFIQGGGTSAAGVALSVCDWGMVPSELTRLGPDHITIPLGPDVTCVIGTDWTSWASPLVSMFLHGSWGHILSNSLFLWVFGNNVEDVMGRARFAAFYLLCGLIAGGAHVLVSPASVVPTVGASGAISGALGAYLLLYPRSPVRMFFPPLFFLRLPAWLVLIWWFAIQFLSGLPQLLAPAPAISGGVAVWAHIGGFAAGVLLSRAFEDPELIAKHREAARLRDPPVPVAWR